MAKRKSVTRIQPNVYEFTIKLVDTKPLVWRKVLAHEFIELNELHLLIQASMGWKDYHLYSFEIDGKAYVADEDSNLIENDVQLMDILGDTKKFTYTYDFGDDWLHEIEITKTLTHDHRINYPICIDGANACPPEDCGGVHRFEDLKSVLSGKDSSEKNELLTWLGGFYNPTTFDPNFVNQYLLSDARD